MDGPAFARLRSALGKSQRELADLLGLSRKAVESYEQGWRRVPPHVERVLYYLLFRIGDDDAAKASPCWESRDCPEESRSKCVAYVAREGRFCWFLTGRLCAGARPATTPDAGVDSGGSPSGKPAGCRGCPVFSERLARAEGA